MKISKAQVMMMFFILTQFTPFSGMIRQKRAIRDINPLVWHFACLFYDPFSRQIYALRKCLIAVMIYFAHWNCAKDKTVFIFKESDPEKRSDPVGNTAGDSTVDKINDITDGVAQEMQDSWNL